MSNREMKNKTQVVHLGNLALSGTTPAASDWVDLRDADAVTFVPVMNTVTDAGTASGFSFEVQDSNDTADANAVAVADLELAGLESDMTVTSDAADDSLSATIGYLGNKRYARLEATGTTGTNADVSVIAILHYLTRSPTGAGVGTSVAAT